MSQMQHSDGLIFPKLKQDVASASIKSLYFMSTGKSTHLDKKQLKETEGGRSALNHKCLLIKSSVGPRGQERLLIGV